ncbi:MAG: hypothetical protein QOG43_485 [Actinomycetota bacterium]|nr:hypothetical protein [Actinomycetota bacterium]
MRAGADSCTCEQCGVVCTGRFQGCPEVWARGPIPVLLTAAATDDLPLALTRGPHEANGHEARATPAHPGGLEVAASVTAEGDVLPPDHPRSPDGFRWSEGAFEALRGEVDALRGAMAQEQALVASLVANGRPDAGPDVESLRAMVDSAVRKAVRREAVALGDTVAAILEGVRRDLVAMRQSNEAHVTAFKESTEQVANATSALPAAVREANEAGLAGLKESVDEVAAATSALPAELGRHDAANRKAFRTTLNLELQPLIEVVAESIAQSDYELKAIGAKLDALAASNAALADDLAEVIAQVGELAWTDEDGAATESPPPPARFLPLARPADDSTPAGGRPAGSPSTGGQAGSADPPMQGTKVSLRGSRR